MIRERFPPLPAGLSVSAARICREGTERRAGNPMESVYTLSAVAESPARHGTPGLRQVDPEERINHNDVRPERA